MKKAMKQSKLIAVLNGISIFALILMALLLLFYANVDKKLSQNNEDRFNLTYNANRFMNGSAYLTNEVRAYAATGDQVHYDNYWNEINNLKNRDQGVAAMQEIGITSGEQSMIDEMSALSNKLVPLEEFFYRADQFPQGTVPLGAGYTDCRRDQDIEPAPDDHPYPHIYGSGSGRCHSARCDVRHTPQDPSPDHRCPGSDG